MDISNWADLGAFGVIATILCVVLVQQGKQHGKLMDEVMDVVRANTSSMTAMEKALNGLPEFLRQTSERLGRGAERFDAHERRLDKLERET